jgi:hypothetical protein
VDEEKSGRGFKVEDRRRFSATGETREEAATQADAPPEPPAPPPPPNMAGDDSARAVAEMTFSTFIIGLSTQALVLLGDMPDPSSNATFQDLDGAKQLIDILGILEAKTKGNLDAGESNLLSTVLYDLRMRYVQQSRTA